AHLPRVADLGHHVEVMRPQQPGQTVPQQRQVFSDDNSHGPSIVTVVGPPGGLLSSIMPSNDSSRRATPCRPVPASRRAPPRPFSPTMTARRPPTSRRPTQVDPAPLCLTTLARHSAAVK